MDKVLAEIVANEDGTVTAYSARVPSIPKGTTLRGTSYVKARKEVIFTYKIKWWAMPWYLLVMLYDTYRRRNLEIQQIVSVEMSSACDPGYSNRAQVREEPAEKIIIQ